MDRLKQYSEFYYRKNDDDYDIKKTYKKIDDIENESLDSTYRALRSLNETEKIGFKAAAVRF